jgi:hypothetical protein
MALSTLAFPSSARKPISDARLRAQRANAQLSTGPRTQAGRRRSALNRLGIKSSGPAGWGGSQIKGQRAFLRVWHDLLAAFCFVKPEAWRWNPRLGLDVKAAALVWSEKLLAARQGFRRDGLNASIHSHLSQFIFEFESCNQKCHYWLEKEFGADGRSDIVKLREGIEARLGSFREAAAAWGRREKQREKKGAPRHQTQSAMRLKKLGLASNFQTWRPELSGNEPTPVNDRRCCRLNLEWRTF